MQEEGEKKSVMSANTISLPVIDLAKFPSERNKLAEVCSNLGCFRVVNHGVPTLLLAEMKTVARYIFNMPDEIKLSYTKIMPGSGYESPTSKNPLFEAFAVYNAALSSDIHAFCARLDITPAQREVIISYVSKLYALILELTSKVADSLGLVGYSFEDYHCLFRLHKYNFTNESVGFCGLTHTDLGFLTILHEDESVGGLQLIDSTGNFLFIEPVPGTFVVNLGDMAKVWSNGRLFNIKHRVKCKEGMTRITIGLFMLAPMVSKVEPQQELIDSEHPRLYRAFLFEEYKKYWNSFEDKTGVALSLLAADQTTVKA